jgi:hypothetical protein
MSDEQYDPLDLRGQEMARQKREQDERFLRQRKADDVKRLMSSRWGRRFMWELLAAAGTYQQTFNTNAMQMAFNEGKRSVGNQLLAYVQATCPERFVEMLKEHQDDERRSNDRSTTN